MSGAENLATPLYIVRGMAFLLLTGLLLVASPALAATPLDYSVSISGVEDTALKDSVLRVSQLIDKKRRAVFSLRALRRRVEESLPRIEALLRARGYYAAKKKYLIARKDEKAASVTLQIDLGPAYRFRRYEMRLSPPAQTGWDVAIPIKELGVSVGEAAEASVIAASDARLLAAFARRAYPLARIVDRKIVVDHKAQTLSVEVSVAAGPYARFGAIRVEGLETVAPVLVRRHATWTPGKPFNSDALESTRKKLRQTGLFSSVLVRNADKTDAQGRLDILVTVKERKHRSLGAGASYSSTEGVLGKLFWEHRNLLGHGERLRLRAEGGEIRQGVFGDLRVPDFGAMDQDLVVDARLAKEQPEGFTSIETAAVARLERRLSKAYLGSAGIGLDRSDIEENDESRNFTFLIAPLSLRRDTTDDLLDPGRGGRDILTITPNMGILGTGENFVVARLFDSIHLPLMAEKKLVLAGWARIGTILGEETLAIPANKRLYAGGSGSVRGYALNSIGPLDAQNDPVGGRASTEIGIELRWRVAGPFGLVAFAEAGGIYDDPLPQWGKDLRWGAGLGLRYYIPKIGPIRLDVAVPLNRRNSVDDAFQILVSLGQAF